MELLFHMPPELVVVDKRYNTGDEEIDIVVKNNMPGTFWSALASPLLFVECKNWKEKAGAPEARDFAGKLRHHSGLVRLGFFVSLNGFTSQFDETLKREAATGCSIIKIAASDIERYAEGMAEMGEWIEGLIIKLV